MGLNLANDAQIMQMVESHQDLADRIARLERLVETVADVSEQGHAALMAALRRGDFDAC